MNVPRELHLHPYEPSDVMALPNAEAVTDHAIIAGDLFICALGFEERCPYLSRFIAEKAVTGKHLFKRGILIEYTTNQADNEINQRQLAEAFDKFAGRTDRIRSDELGAASDFVHAILGELDDGNASPLQVTMDISACSGALVLTLVKAVLESRVPTQLTVLYSQAAQYFPSHQQFSEETQMTVARGSALANTSNVFAESGAQEPHVLPTFGGCHNDGRPDLVVAFPSFRSNRLVRCLGSIGEQLTSAPDQSVFWIFGRPISAQDQWRGQLQRQIVAATFKNLGVTTDQGEKWFTEENSLDCCVFDYRKSGEALLKICDLHLGKNISLIPMGTKMQNLGLTLALIVREEVAVLTAIPDAFIPTAYSKGIGTAWRIAFPPSKNVLKILQKIGQLGLSTDRGVSITSPFGVKEVDNE